MIDAVGIGPVAPRPPDSPAASRSKSETVPSAAQQFEALLLAQMLRSARESCTGNSTGEDSSESDSVMEIAEQQFAQVMAAGGGLGIAKLVVNGLKQPQR